MNGDARRGFDYSSHTHTHIGSLRGRGLLFGAQVCPHVGPNIYPHRIFHTQGRQKLSMPEAIENGGLEHLTSRC